MLKCIPPTLGLDLDPLRGRPEDLESVDEELSPIVMGLRRIKSDLVGPELIASATSYLKGYVLGAFINNSGASNVAINNKIEQAMDLVKTHLMFAVHEEVESLKEQIRDLTEKNLQLEHENCILRETATAETLAKLESCRL